KNTVSAPFPRRVRRFIPPSPAARTRHTPTAISGHPGLSGVGDPATPYIIMAANKKIAAAGKGRGLAMKRFPSYPGGNHDQKNAENTFQQFDSHPVRQRRTEGRRQDADRRNDHQGRKIDIAYGCRRQTGSAPANRDKTERAGQS